MTAPLSPEVLELDAAAAALNVASKALAYLREAPSDRRRRLLDQIIYLEDYLDETVPESRFDQRTRIAMQRAIKVAEGELGLVLAEIAANED